MDEADWLKSTDPQAMLAFLRDSGKLSGRKARLFACGAVRRVWHLLTDERSRKTVEVAEQNADGLATDKELAFARDATGFWKRSAPDGNSGRAVLTRTSIEVSSYVADHDPWKA